MSETDLEGIEVEETDPRPSSGRVRPNFDELSRPAGISEEDLGRIETSRSRLGYLAEQVVVNIVVAAIVALLAAAGGLLLAAYGPAGAAAGEVLLDVLGLR